METASDTGGASAITTGREGSGAEISGTGASDCGSIKDGSEAGSISRAGSTGSDRDGTDGSTLKVLESSLEKVGGSSGREGSSERRADGDGWGSLNETSSSEVDVLDRKENSGSGTDSGRTDSNSLASCKLVPGLESAAGELGDKVSPADLHAPSKTVFHENGAIGEESAADRVETSGSGSAAGIVDGSAAKIDSLASVKSGPGTGLGNWFDTHSGRDTPSD
jgi:hypothetical protein